MEDTMTTNDNSESLSERIKDLSGNDLKKELAKEKVKQLILMIQRQTDYDYDTAKQELINCNFNAMTAISNYLQIQKKVKEEPKCVNQQIYKEIRTFMDNGIRQYEKKKEYEEFLQKKYEQMKAKDEQMNSTDDTNKKI